MATTVLPGSLVMDGADFTLWRGTNSPQPIWDFASMNLAGSVMVLAVRWGGGSFSTSSAPDDPNIPTYGPLVLLARRDIDEDADPPPSRFHRDVVLWEFSPEAVAEMPLGRVARYELRREVRREGGERRVYQEGYFDVRGLA